MFFVWASPWPWFSYLSLQVLELQVHTTMPSLLAIYSIPWNCDPPDLCFLRSLGYWQEPLHLKLYLYVFVCPSIHIYDYFMYLLLVIAFIYGALFLSFFFFLAILGFELRVYILSYSTSPFCVGFFWGRVSWTVCPGWLRTVILLISASWVARITGMSHLTCVLNSFMWIQVTV
jgi:hypothetical protein